MDKTITGLLAMVTGIIFIIISKSDDGGRG